MGLQGQFAGGVVFTEKQGGCDAQTQSSSTKKSKAVNCHNIQDLRIKFSLASGKKNSATAWKIRLCKIERQ